jgi:hypothetical protein
MGQNSVMLQLAPVFPAIYKGLLLTIYDFVEEIRLPDHM